MNLELQRRVPMRAALPGALGAVGLALSLLVTGEDVVNHVEPTFILVAILGATAFLTILGEILGRSITPWFAGSRMG